MAVVPRKTKGGIVYYVDTRGHRERIGFDKREAERVDARNKKQVKAGTFAPEVSGAVKVGTYLQTWLDSRKNRAAVTDKSLIRNYALKCEWLCAMRMEDVRPRHAKKFVNELYAIISEKTGKPLAPKYISNISGAVSSAFSAAALDEVTHGNVWKLPVGLLSKLSEETEPYTREEAAKLLATATGGRRIWLMLAFYTGMRCGEVCGRRWSHWDRTRKPLGLLAVKTQYNDLPIKGDSRNKLRPRAVPVHPELQKALEEWWSAGFAEVYLRAPTVDDFIVPRRSDSLKNLQRSASYKAVAADCEKAKVTCRGQHATRHTYITEAQRNVPDEKLIEKITHNAKGTQLNQYTHRHWDELCAAMLCLRPYGEKNEKETQADRMRRDSHIQDPGHEVLLAQDGSDAQAQAQDRGGYNRGLAGRAYRPDSGQDATPGPALILDAALDSSSPPLENKGVDGSDSRTRTPGSARESADNREYTVTKSRNGFLILRGKPNGAALLAAGQDSRLSWGERNRLGDFDAKRVAT